MSLVSVPAVYDGNEVRLLESISVEGPYRVVVTFLEPLPGGAAAARDEAGFWGSFGAWQDDRSPDELVRDIRAARQSKPGPPEL
jgi:hypothetical protein